MRKTAIAPSAGADSAKQDWAPYLTSEPGVFQPYGGFPDGVTVDNGHILLPELPGIGFEGKADLFKEMQALSA